MQKVLRRTGLPGTIGKKDVCSAITIMITVTVIANRGRGYVRVASARARQIGHPEKHFALAIPH